MPETKKMTDIDLSDAFTKACDFTAKVQLVKIPSDFISVQKSPDSYGGKVELRNSIKPEHGKAIADYLEGQSNDKPDLIVIDSAGGNSNAAKDIMSKMSTRSEIVLIYGPASSASAQIAVSGDNTYAIEGSRIITHKVRKAFENREEMKDDVSYMIDLNNLRSVTEKEGPFFGEDFILTAEKVRELYPDDQKALELAQYYQEVGEEMLQMDADVKTVLKNASPSIDDVCASYLVRAEDTILSAEDALKLNLIDAIIIPAEQDQKETMLVRADDPRAEKLRNENPALFDELNPPENAEPETTPNSTPGFKP